MSTGIATFRAGIHPDNIASQRVATRLGLAETEELDSDGDKIWKS